MIMSARYPVLPAVILLTVVPSCLCLAQVPNSLPLDDPNTVVRAVIAALEGLEFPSSGRGTAIWKHKGRFRNHEGKDLTVEFAFKGQSSLMDVLEPANSAKRMSTRLYANIMSDKSYIAVNPENAQIDQADPFRRRVTQDFHPDAIMKFHHTSLSDITAVFLEPGFNLSVSLDAEGILHLRGQKNLDRPGPGTESQDYQKAEFAFDTRAGLLPVFLTSIRKSPNRESQVTHRFRWVMYGSVPYVTSIICHGKGEREIYDEFIITSFKPNVQISDEEFTLDGLGIPDGLPVYDKLAGVEYRYGGVLSTEELDKPLGDANFVQKIRAQNDIQGPNLLDVNMQQDPADPNRVLATDSATQEGDSVPSRSITTVSVLILVGIAALLLYVVRFRQKQG